MIPIIIQTIENEDDREFMAALYNTYHRLLYKAIFDIVHDPWHTDDIMQTVLLKLIDRIPLLRSLDKRHLIDYICAAARNTAYNFARAHKNEILEDYDLENEPSSINIEGDIIFKEDITLLAKVWDDLDEKTQYLLYARYILQKSSKEIAEELELSPSNARMAIVRAKRKVKKIMDNREK